MAFNSTTFAQDITIDQFDKITIEVTQKFIDALNANTGDETADATVALPYINNSEYDASGTGLKKDRVDFSLKKSNCFLRF